MSWSVHWSNGLAIQGSLLPARSIPLASIAASKTTNRLPNLSFMLPSSLCVILCEPNGSRNRGASQTQSLGFLSRQGTASGLSQGNHLFSHPGCHGQRRRNPAHTATVLPFRQHCPPAVSLVTNSLLQAASEDPCRAFATS